MGPTKHNFHGPGYPTKYKEMQVNADYKNFCSSAIGGTTLEVTTEFSALGLLKNHKLSWNSHIDKISSKANKVLGLIKSNCREFRDVLTLRTLYCALVRSQLEYGSVVWSPFTCQEY